MIEDEFEVLDVIVFVILEELFDLCSKISCTAADVQEDGYWLPLKAVRNKIMKMN